MKLLSEIHKKEKGQALIITTILLLVGGLVIAPLLGFMSTGLLTGQVYEEKLNGLYAADAGIEDALWKLLNGYYSPPHYLTDVNGMNVTVVELGQEPTADGTLYTLQSTAELGGEIKAEIIAQVEVVVGSAVAGGGEGGEYGTNEETVALSLINENTIIFTTQNKSLFKGINDTDYTEIDPWDLGALNMSTGKGYLYLDGNLVMTNPQYRIRGVHYYQEGGSDYLLMVVRDNDTVGTVTYSSSDIIQLEVVVDESDPNNPYISAVNNIQLFDTIEGADIAALSRWDDTGAILFSMHTDTILGGTQFYRAEIIEYDPVNQTYTSVVDTNYVLGDIPNQPALELDLLAVLSASDPRLLLSFTADAGVTGTDGQEIQAEDIAIWDPVDPNDPDDDTINLHISMTEETMAISEAIITASIISWEINQ